MKTKWKITLRAFVFACLITVAVIAVQAPRTVEHLPLQDYENLKKALVTKGTRLSTVVIFSANNKRSFSGTLVDDGKIKVVITVAHSFAERSANTSYEYVLDSERYPIRRVCSHPGSGTFGGKDIAFCFPGKSKKIKHYWKWDTDTRWQVQTKKFGPFGAALLQGNKVVVIKGILMSDGLEPIYAVEHRSEDGDSGSGLIIRGQAFFVLKGNLKESTLDTVEAFGINRESVTLITEL